MIDAFLVFFLVTLIPIAFIGIGNGAEHALFVGWRWLQVATLFGASAYVVYQLVRRGWRDLLVVALVAAAIVYVMLSYVGVAWDAQIEYNRVLQLVHRYGGLTDAYRHGITHWILGYPPGTSLSAMFYLTLHMPSANFAQGILLLLWSGTFVARHMRDVDLPGRLVFFVLMGTGTQFLWHASYFYNNLFYALIWAQLTLVPMFGSSLRPWERCAYALVLVWLRPQWQIAAIPIGLSALATVLVRPTIERRFVRDTVLVMMAALAVAWLGSNHWRNVAAHLDDEMSRQNQTMLEGMRAQQDQYGLDIVVSTKGFAQQTAPPAPLLRESVSAIGWAFDLSKGFYPVSFGVLAAAALLALVALRRRGLVFLVPLLSPLAIIVGTAVFAHGYAQYRANAWALERLEIVVPILAAGALTALHRAFRLQAR